MKRLNRAKEKVQQSGVFFLQTFPYLHPPLIITTLSPTPHLILSYTRLGSEFPHPFWNRRHFDESGNIGSNRVRIRNKNNILIPKTRATQYTTIIVLSPSSRTGTIRCATGWTREKILIYSIPGGFCSYVGDNAARSTFSGIELLYRSRIWGLFVEKYRDKCCFRLI